MSNESKVLIKEADLQIVADMQKKIDVYEDIFGWACMLLTTKQCHRHIEFDVEDGTAAHWFIHSLCTHLKGLNQE